MLPWCCCVPHPRNFSAPSASHLPFSVPFRNFPLPPPNDRSGKEIRGGGGERIAQERTGKWRYMYWQPGRSQSCKSFSFIYIYRACTNLGFFFENLQLYLTIIKGTCTVMCMDWYARAHCSTPACTSNPLRVYKIAKLIFSGMCKCMIHEHWARIELMVWIRSPESDITQRERRREGGNDKKAGRERERKSVW